VAKERFMTDCNHHEHGHAHIPANYNRAFAIGVALNVIYIVFEAGYGFAIGSLALLADAGHNLGDVLGLILAWGAHYLSQLKPTMRHTYGLRSTSILAALLNAVLLLVAMGGILWEAVGRFAEPSPVAGVTIIWVALLGVAINTATAVMFLRGREKDINIRAAFLHMAADALVSLAVVAGGVAIIIWQWYWLDPVLSITIAIVILFGTWGLLKDSLNLALHAVPHGINAQHVLEYLQSRPGVSGVHDLHIWAISTTESALTAHIVAPNLSVEENNEFLFETEKALRHEFEISHMTLQIERADDERQCHQLSSDSACRFLP